MESVIFSIYKFIKPLKNYYFDLSNSYGVINLRSFLFSAIFKTSFDKFQIYRAKW